MPRLGDDRLIRLFGELHDQARVLVCSAYVEDQALRNLLRAGHYAVLPKPFSPFALRDAVASALAGPVCSTGL